MNEPYAAPAASMPSVSQLSLPLASATGWMKFIGVIFIIQGVLTALTIVGIIVAWLPIWIGVLLMQAASAIERAQYNDEAGALMEALGKLKTYFIIQGILILLGIIFAVLYFVFFGAFILSMMHSHAFY